MASAWLVCVALTAVSVVAFDSERSSDLVFCPLQNHWVKKDKPAKPKPSLSAICAGNKTKKAFLEKLIQVTNVSPQDKASLENLFFSFQAKGDRAFAEMPSSPGAPERQIAVIERIQPGIGVNRTIAVAAVTQIFSLEQLSRPPTHKVAVNFVSHAVRELDNISSSIAPRAPPVSL